jgi:hypothetical protein
VKLAQLGKTNTTRSNPTLRAAFSKVLGESGHKEYDYLVLLFYLSEKDRSLAALIRDDPIAIPHPEDPTTKLELFAFVVPYNEVVGLTCSSGKRSSPYRAIYYNPMSDRRTSLAVRRFAVSSLDDFRRRLGMV